MTLKNTLENYLGDLLNKDPQVKEQLDKLFPNDSTIKKIMDNGIGENEMAKFEKIESEYISGKDLIGIENITFKILTEVKEEMGKFGIKPKCSVDMLKQGVIYEKLWNLNQGNINFLVDNFGDESAQWTGKTVKISTKQTDQGNTAIILTGTV